MNPVSEAVERVGAFIRIAERAPETDEPFTVDEGVMRNHLSDLHAILADHARLTEQLRVAREGLEEIAHEADADDDTPAVYVLQLVEDHARETLTRMEKNDDA